MNSIKDNNSTEINNLLSNSKLYILITMKKYILYIITYLFLSINTSNPFYIKVILHILILLYTLNGYLKIINRLMYIIFSDYYTQLIWKSSLSSTIQYFPYIITHFSYFSYDFSRNILFLTGIILIILSNLYVSYSKLVFLSNIEYQSVSNEYSNSNKHGIYEVYFLIIDYKDKVYKGISLIINEIYMILLKYFIYNTINRSVSIKDEEENEKQIKNPYDNPYNPKLNIKNIEKSNSNNIYLFVLKRRILSIFLLTIQFILFFLIFQMPFSILNSSSNRQVYGNYGNIYIITSCIMINQYNNTKTSNSNSNSNSHITNIDIYYLFNLIRNQSTSIHLIILVIISFLLLNQIYLECVFIIISFLFCYFQWEVIDLFSI